MFEFHFSIVWCWRDGKKKMAETMARVRAFFGVVFGILAIAYYLGLGFEGGERTTAMSQSFTSPPSSPVVVVGGILFDILCSPSDTSSPIALHTSNPGHVRQSWGGVRAKTLFFPFNPRSIRR